MEACPGQDDRYDADMSTDERVDPRRMRKAAVDLWFAVERMKRGNPKGTLPLMSPHRVD